MNNRKNDFTELEFEHYRNQGRKFFEGYTEDPDKTNAIEWLLVALHWLGKIPVSVQNQTDTFYLFQTHLNLARLHLNSPMNVFLANIHYERALGYFSLLSDKSFLENSFSIDELLTEIKACYLLAESYCKDHKLQNTLDSDSEDEGEIKLTEHEKSIIKNLEPDFDFEEKVASLQKAHRALSEETFGIFSLFSKNRTSEIEKCLAPEKEKPSVAR